VSAPIETGQTTSCPSDTELDAVLRLVGETEQRRSEQINRVAQLREQAGGAALADVRLAEQVLKEIETTLVLARACRTVLRSLSEP
jgi:hypothetical protein